jgi:hypothetical protein
MNQAGFLVFGDLHGRVLPAFRLATVWSREHEMTVTGILQVGDLGYFPDPSRLDKATRRQAEDDPLELGSQLVAEPSTEADAVFSETGVPQGLWFTAGNHEDFDALEAAAQGTGDCFVVDAYDRLLCIRDGRVAQLPGGCRAGALWGIDDRSPRARPRTPARARIRERSATRLSCTAFDVLLAHDGPRDAILPEAGSEFVTHVIRSAQPAFAFFGHYKGRGHAIAGDFGKTQVFHLCGFELRQRGGCPEPGSVGVLRWRDGACDFAYVEEAWLRTFTRHNWQYR